MIAIRSDLDVISREVKLRSGAEMLAVELTFPTGEKTVICTCYRVGTLAERNHDVIVENIRSILSKRRPPKVHIVGDFNFPHACWDSNSSSVPIEQSFMDSFNDLGLTQLIKDPTHLHGNVLDLLLTNSESHIYDIHVLDCNSVCKSDHLPITFDIKSKVNVKKSRKRKCYNFKKANWDALNSELRHTNWNPLICCEVGSFSKLNCSDS